jgi:SAM-dependent methyltransferase
LEQLLPNHAKSILDAGCGRGVISRMLARRYPGARIDAIDQDAAGQDANRLIAQQTGLKNCRFKLGDLTELNETATYDLIVSIDNLEHIVQDIDVLQRFYRAMADGGTLLVHVPHYYRRWPILNWSVNFDVPGHVRPGYHLPEIVERVRKSGFLVERSGFSYGFLENLANNIGYAITAAEEKKRVLYAVLFPLLNFMAWVGHWSTPTMGAGVWVVATKKQDLASPEESYEDIDNVD